MSVGFKVAHTRRHTYLFAPKSLKPHPELNGRFVETDIEALLADLVSNGQTVPLVIRSDGGMPVIIDGHRRWRAALEGLKRKLLPQEFRLECVYFKGNEQQAFLAAVRANHHRTDKNPIDDAHNISKMERFGMTHEEIAAVYRESVSWVKNTLKLVTLSQEGAEALSSGKLKAPAARALAKLSQEAQREALASGKPIPKPQAKKPAAAIRLAAVEEALRVIVEREEMPSGIDVAGMRAEDAVVAVCAKLAELLRTAELSELGIGDAARVHRVREKAS